MSLIVKMMSAGIALGRSSPSLGNVIFVPSCSKNKLDSFRRNRKKNYVMLAVNWCGGAARPVARGGIWGQGTRGVFLGFPKFSCAQKIFL